MKKPSHLLFAVLPLLLGLADASWAQPVRVFGPPEPGTARPPLHIYFDPSRTQPLQSSPPATAFTPMQIQQAYGFNLISANGSGQTIAIVDAYGDGTLSSDVAAFNTQFGLPQFNQPGGPTLTVVAQAGTRATSSGWALETALDVEWAHAIAPQANIQVVLAKSSSLGNLLSAVQYATSHGASVVSMSWGGSEFSSEASYDSYFNVPKVTCVASAGDSGEANSGVEWPAASPYVVSIGGTSLYLSSGNYSSETVWNNSSGATGGGISLYETEPPYQSGWQQSPSGTKRTVPDVSYDGDPYTGVSVYCASYQNGPWFQVGGTSIGAPQWSALIALVNQSHSSALGPGNAAIYSLAQGTQSTTPYAIPASYFHDIVQGNNGSDPDDQAVTGYDFCTGLGTPVVSALVPNLP